MDGDGTAAVLFGCLDQLFEDRLFAQHDIVAQQNRKGLVSHKAAGAPHGMAEALGLLLAQKQHICHIRHFPDHPCFLLFSVPQQAILQVGGIVKIVLNGRLAAVGDDQDLLDAGSDSLFDNVLQNRFVHQGQHFLGDAFGVRQQPRAESGRGDNGLSDFHGCTSFVVFVGCSENSQPQ